MYDLATILRAVYVTAQHKPTPPAVIVAAHFAALAAVVKEAAQ